MENGKSINNAARNVKTNWVKHIVTALVFEKSIQHIFVTAAFYFNWKNIGSTVAVDPEILMILGAVIAIFFILSLWGIMAQKRWAINLITALALFDIIGEFVAQGKIDIMINVSFIVAAILLVLSLFYRRHEKGS